MEKIVLEIMEQIDNHLLGKGNEVSASLLGDIIGECRMRMEACEEGVYQ